jgi:hypothetical protein
MYKKNALALGLIAACLTCVGVAQQNNSTAETPAEVLRNIPHNSNDIEQLRAGLSSPDPSVRVATFSAMMQSNNPSLTTIANCPLPTSLHRPTGAAADASPGRHIGLRAPAAP